MERPTEPGGPMRSWCTTPDGIDLAVYDFGGGSNEDRTPLLLVHATGFCAEVFTPLARYLSEGFRCWGLDLRAHGRSGRPPDGNFAWAGFATDVLTAVDHLGLDRPLAFGHSCGGASLLLAEEARPGTFAALYCFEPIVVPAEPVEPSVENVPLAGGALRRRESFPSVTDAFVNFSAKPPFNALDPEALQWYVEAGFEMVPDDEGGDGSAIRLRCRRHDEAQVYAHGLSHDAFEHLAEVRCPVTLACGERTDAFGSAVLELDAARLRDGTVLVLPGLGHFGPLEQPATVAASVAAALGSGRSAGSDPNPDDVTGAS